MTRKIAVPVYGRDLLCGLSRDWFSDCLVFCAPEAWETAKDRFPAAPRAVAVPRSMERAVIEEQIRGLPAASAVFGIGGGSALDAAKMYSILTGARIALVPSAMSVDAGFCRAVGVRAGGRVRYVGDAPAEVLLVDYDLIERAPPALNRAGVGDVLSIFTALWDWRLAHETLGERLDEHVFNASRGLLDRLFEGAAGVAACNEAGIRLLSDLYAAEVRLCEEFGSSRPEEGSEHYFAYCLEAMTRRPFIHGQIVSLGVVLAALHQEQPIELLLGKLAEFKVLFRPEDIGVTHLEIEQALLRLPSYLDEEKQLPYGIFHHKGMDGETARSLMASFERVAGQG